jgi:hypothetical protein
VKKLLRSGLIRETGDGYVVDRIVWQNMIRMRRTIIPFQAVYAVFLAAAFVVMVLVFRGAPEEGYVFGAIAILVALGFSLFETVKALRQVV